MICRVAEDPLLGQVRQNQSVLRDLSHITLIIGEDKEEHFVLDDRTADTGAVLIAVGVVLGSVLQILEVRLRVQERIVIRIEDRSMNVIRTRACAHLDLSGAAAERRIDVVRTDANFFNHVRTGEDCGISAIRRVITAIVRRQTVASRVDGSDRGPAEIRHLGAEGICGVDNARG